jgi:uncharacterized protein
VKTHYGLIKALLPVFAYGLTLFAAYAAFGQTEVAGDVAGAAMEHTSVAAPDVQGMMSAETGSSMPWWMWPLILFVVTFVMGIAAVLAGVGGGVLFVPIIGGFFPFHVDFVRGAGLLVALAGAVAAGPGLLKKGMANLRLAIPIGLIASASAIVGAQLGLQASKMNPGIIQVGLGLVILLIVGIMLKAKKSDFPDVPRSDRLSQMLGIYGIYHDEASGKDFDWRIHRTLPGLLLFIVIGLMAGFFGLGAGWANVPVLNLLMGAPLKVSVATSKFLLSITDTSAAWVYINKGAVLPMIAVPSVLGIMLGSFVGVKILAKAKPTFIKWMVIAILLFAGGKALQKGLSLFGVI